MNKDIKVFTNDNSNIQEIKFDKAIQNFLERTSYENYDIKNIEIENNTEIDFIKINHICYDRSKDETDINLIDFQQILSAISSKSQKFVYVIEGNINGISLYLGTQKDSKEFLLDTFNGIYSGSEVINSKPNFDSDVLFSKAMLGIPALKRDSGKNYKQSLEKILFPLQGKNFRIVLVAESYNNESVKTIISNYRDLGSELHRFVKQSKNMQESLSKGTTSTTGTSSSKTISNSKSNTDGFSDKAVSSKVATMGATAAGVLVGTSFLSGPFAPPLGLGVAALGGLGVALGSIFGSKTNNHSETKSRTNSNTESTNKSYSENENISNTLGITFDEINKSAEYCEALIDKYIERFQKGLNHGMWNTSLYIQSDNEVVLSSLEHTLKSVYSGDETYFESIRFSNNLGSNKKFDIAKLPMLYFDKSIIHPIHKSFTGFSSAINTEELSILSALPNNDIEGISVSKISSFGQTQSKVLDKYHSIKIGNILNKKKTTNQRFRLSLESLNSHLFVSGITGGGKSNTIKYLLTEVQSDKLEYKIPFLVIEPAKSEYKHLLKNIPSLQIFRPGAKDDIFKLNPFIFEHSRKNHSVSLTKHVDMLKSTFSSAFPMYGPMPYILEEAIYNIYKNKGWSFETEDHPFFTDSDEADMERKSLLFPNMNDLKEEVVNVAENAGYYQDIQSNIKAALETRIKNLTLGIKGRIFNSRHTFDSKILFEKPTIIELSNIVDDDEKAFLMGLLLNKLYQYKEEQGTVSKLTHLTVIEEAHRLLPNISLDKSMEDSGSKAKAIETFTNILAEIRAYGEGIIVADQIASKLNRDVIKNTNIKIIHRTMDYEDREIVGKSINLSDEQILDIAELKAGEAIVHNRDIHQAFMVKIDEYRTDKIKDLEILNFYKKFISNHNEYQYEFIFEKYFAVENKDELTLFSQDIDCIKIKLIEFINFIIFDSQNIGKKWEELKNYLGKFQNEKLNIYLLINVWDRLNYLSNLEYYKDVDSYLDTYKSFIRLILTLIDDIESQLKNRCDKFKECFLHNNLKTIFPSMRYYLDYDIDYTLLLLENITSNIEAFEYLNTVMKEDIEVNIRFDKILNKIFKTTSSELRYSLGAIRSGKKEIDFNKIVKEGF